MEVLKEIAHISGKPGLYRVIKPTRTGVIVEAIDGKKGRSVVNGNARVSVLNDISIYGETDEATRPLPSLLAALHQQYNGELPLEAKAATDEELRTVLGEVFPAFDRERVYPSDIRKVLAWYKLLVEHQPDIFTEAPAVDAE